MSLFIGCPIQGGQPETIHTLPAKLNLEGYIYMHLYIQHIRMYNTYVCNSSNQIKRAINLRAGADGMGSGKIVEGLREEREEGKRCFLIFIKIILKIITIIFKFLSISEYTDFLILKLREEWYAKNLKILINFLFIILKDNIIAE